MTNRMRNRISVDVGAGARGAASVPDGESFTLYVHSVTGNDSNDGKTPATAKLTIANALTALPAAGGTIRVTAPDATPTNGFHTISAGTVIIEGTNRVPWYTERTMTWTSGWTDAGGGVYSRVQAGDADMMFVPTMLDANGFGRMLTKNTGTPTTPAAGEFGVSGGSFYVHLVGDANANSHTIKRHNTGYLYRASGTAQLIIRDAIGRYGGGNGMFECNASGATLILENCIGIYSASVGVSLPVAGAGTVVCTDCTMQRHNNDGYNVHAGILTLNNCDASYNNDEGASNHDGTTLTINGGRYHHNFAGGCTVVNSGSVMHLTNVEVDNNGAKAGGGIETNGINFDTGTSGSVMNVNSHDNTGAGFYCNAATVTITNLTSGLAAGNTAPDDEC